VTKAAACHSNEFFSLGNRPDSVSFAVYDSSQHVALSACFRSLDNFYPLRSLFFFDSEDLSASKMGHGGNNAVPHVHQRKHWTPSCTHKGNFRVHLDQPAKKIARRRRRLEKARRVFPRPLTNLKPSVACPTVRYNMKRRLGAGFSLEELKAAEIHPKFARTIGIAVDGRRKNTSEEGLKVNVQRLKTYMAKLVVFPLNHKKVQKGEASDAECKTAVQDRSRFGKSLPHPSTKAVKEAVLPTQKLTKEDKKKKVFKFLKNALSAERFFGERIRRAEKKAEAAAKKK